MVVNTLLCFVFVWHLAHAGLTLASALAGYVNCVILLFLLIKRRLFKPSPGWLKYSMQLLIANFTIGVYLYFMSGTATYWLGFSPLMRLSLLLAHVFVTVVIYLLVLGIIGLGLATFVAR